MVMFLAVVPGWCLAGDYVIGDGDGLSISVWGAPEFSVGVVVRPDGKITLPAVGDVKATGLTPKQLSDELTVVLDAYVKKPIVTVAVSAITNNQVYISGGGVPSTVVNLVGRTTLFKFLCSLPGIDNVDLANAYLLRNGKKLDVDFFALFVNLEIERDVDLRPEDILYLPTNEKNKIYVVGAVNNPQAVVYREKLRILDAIFECGGFSKYAKQSAVLILRNVDGQDQRIRINVADLVKGGDLAQNVELLRGDYVMVQEGIF
jgi:polysaccharide export outer membrane protein